MKDVKGFGQCFRSGRLAMKSANYVLVLCLMSGAASANPPGDAHGMDVLGPVDTRILDVPRPETALEKEVRGLSEARWAAVMSGDHRKVYDMLSPSYRSLVPWDKYAWQFASGIKGAAPTKARCDDDRCTVSVRLEYVSLAKRSLEPSEMYYEEIWLREDGHWWLYQQ